MTEFVREVVSEASRLGMPAWQRFLLTLALSLLAVLGRRAFVALTVAIPKIKVLGEQDPDPYRPGPIVGNVGPNGEAPTGDLTDPSDGNG